MGSRMNQQAFNRMIAEDLEWLLKQPRTLEREHIADVVREASFLNYTFATLIDVLRFINAHPEKNYTVKDVCGAIRPMRSRDEIARALEYLGAEHELQEWNERGRGMVYQAKESGALNYMIGSETETTFNPPVLSPGDFIGMRTTAQPPRMPGREEDRPSGYILPESMKPLPNVSLSLAAQVIQATNGCLAQLKCAIQIAIAICGLPAWHEGDHRVRIGTHGSIVWNAQDEGAVANPAPVCGAEFRHNAPIGNGVCQCIAHAGHTGKHECGCGNSFDDEQRTYPMVDITQAHIEQKQVSDLSGAQELTGGIFYMDSPPSFCPMCRAVLDIQNGGALVECSAKCGFVRNYR